MNLQEGKWKKDPKTGKFAGSEKGPGKGIAGTMISAGVGGGAAAAVKKALTGARIPTSVPISEKAVHKIANQLSPTFLPGPSDKRMVRDALAFKGSRKTTVRGIKRAIAENKATIKSINKLSNAGVSQYVPGRVAGDIVSQRNLATKTLIGQKQALSGIRKAVASRAIKQKAFKIGRTIQKTKMGKVIAAGAISAGIAHRILRKKD